MIFKLNKNRLKTADRKANGIIVMKEKEALSHLLITELTQNEYKDEQLLSLLASRAQIFCSIPSDTIEY